MGRQRPRRQFARGENPSESEAERSREVAAAVRQVADRLGNTPAVCRRAYIHPAVFEAYAAGTLRPCWMAPGPGRKRPAGSSRMSRRFSRCSRAARVGRSRIRRVVRRRASRYRTALDGL